MIDSPCPWQPDQGLRGIKPPFAALTTLLSITLLPSKFLKGSAKGTYVCGSLHLHILCIQNINLSRLCVCVCVWLSPICVFTWPLARHSLKNLGIHFMSASLSVSASHLKNSPLGINACNSKRNRNIAGSLLSPVSLYTASNFLSATRFARSICVYALPIVDMASALVHESYLHSVSGDSLSTWGLFFLLFPQFFHSKEQSSHGCVCCLPSSALCASPLPRIEMDERLCLPQLLIFCSSATLILFPKSNRSDEYV